MGTPDSLGGRATKASTVQFTLPSGISVADLPPSVAEVLDETIGDKMHATVASPLALVGALAAWAHEREIDLPDLEVSRPRLEDIYLHLTEEPQ